MSLVPHEAELADQKLTDATTSSTSPVVVPSAELDQCTSTKPVTEHENKHRQPSADPSDNEIALPKPSDSELEGNADHGLDEMPVHILSGNLHYTLPFNDGNAAPLTSKPFILSRVYEHYVASPDEYRAVMTERLGRLQATLPRLGSDQLRQAKADIVYLKSILENEGPAVAQVKAGAVWSIKEV